MFFVYGTSGQLFRGSMEQLRQIRGVGSLTRSRGVAAVGRDGRDTADPSGTEGLNLAGPALQLTHKDEPLRPAALAAYTPPPHERRPLTQVAAVMTRQVITLSARSSVQEAWQLLAAKAIGQAPVVDEAGQLVGLLTRADLLKPERLPSAAKQAVVWRALMLQNVKDIMSTPVPSVAADSDIRRVASVLLDTGLPGLPVVDESGQVTGFISRSDILRAVVTDPPLDLWG